MVIKEVSKLHNLFLYFKDIYNAVAIIIIGKGNLLLSAILSFTIIIEQILFVAKIV